MRVRHLFLIMTGLAMLLASQGCVSFPDAPARISTPAIEAETLRVYDDTRLGLQSWSAEHPRAVILALHGMNDYSNAFALPAAYWAEHAGVTTYALDQRGHGRSPFFGRWAGTDLMVEDLRAGLAALRARHPDLPVFALGHSMGAAIILAAAAEEPLDADGIILAAPGLWGGPALPLHYRLTLNLVAGIAPGKTLTGERAGRQASDNIELLRAMFADPLVIKETRLDAVLGVTRAMGRAYRGADGVEGDILFLIGEKDEIIPLKIQERAVGRLKGMVEVRRYQEGWHLLLRDLQAEQVWRDAARWIAERLPPQPAGGAAF